MKIEVPLSPFIMDGATPAHPQPISVYNENIITNYNEGKRFSFREKSPMKTPLVDLNANAPLALAQQRYSPINADVDTRVEIIEPIKLEINANDVSQAAIEAATESLHNTIESMSMQLRQLEYELADERSQHDEIAASLRRDCASLRDALREAETRASLSTDTTTTTPTPDNSNSTLIIDQLKEDLERSKHREAALQATIQRLKQTLIEKEQEHASLMDYLALEKQVEQQEYDQMKGLIHGMEHTINQAHQKTQEWQEKALKYDQDRQQAAENVIKAEMEVDLLAEEHTKMMRQLKYVQNKISSYVATVGYDVPALTRLVREIDGSLCDGSSSAGLGNNNNNNSSSNGVVPPPSSSTSLHYTTDRPTMNTTTSNTTSSSFLPSTIFNKMTPKTTSKTPLTSLRRPLRSRNNVTMTDTRSSSSYYY